MRAHWTDLLGRRPHSRARRAFLGGAGALVALPLLESVGARATDLVAPVRLVFWYLPNGLVLEQLLPASPGPLGAPTRLLAPLASVQSELLLLGGLSNAAAAAEISGDHARGTGSFLTCVPVERAATDRVGNGVSADQVAAAASPTVYRSLELGAESGLPTFGTCDSGYSCTYLRNVSWSDADTPRPKLTNPALVFDLLFAGDDPSLSAAQIAQRRAWRGSVLDHVSAEATALSSRVSAADRSVLDEFLTAVRELELVVSADPPTCDAGDGPDGGLDYPGVVRAMSDLTVLALQCDLTRVVTFMMENGGSYRTFGHVGVDEQHHELSHHQGDPEKIEKLAIIDEWELGEAAYLLERLAATADVDGGSLLDNSLVFVSSEVGDGNAHSHDDLPVILAGRGGGYVEAPGRYLQYDGAPIADLYLAMLEAAGAPVASFGADGTAPLSLEGP